MTQHIRSWFLNGESEPKRTDALKFILLQLVKTMPEDSSDKAYCVPWACTEDMANSYIINQKDVMTTTCRKV
jgi:hypothetical protein